jgi:hypothetical protein
MQQAARVDPDFLPRTRQARTMCRKINPDRQETAVDDSLTKDEFEALAQISRAKKGERVSACVARNTKRLTGIKYVTVGKNGQLALTEKGQQTLFIKRCIDGLRAVANDADAALDADVATFLSKKGHIVPKASSQGFDITQRGRESLEDIDSTGR